MIVVRVELWSAITGEISEIARMSIANVGGATNSGDYECETYRGRDKAALDRSMRARPRTLAHMGAVKKHSRLKEHVWNLVAKALIAMDYGK